MNAMINSVEASSAMNGRLIGDESVTFNSVEIDSREVRANSLFFAIRGLTQDGHQYVEAAIQQGAAAVVVEQVEETSKVPQIVVKETTKALGDLARQWRARFTVPVVGVTGSNGKTTVSRILNVLFQQTIPGIAPKGSFNNHWGVPLTLLRLREHHQSAVIEMGMNHPGELKYLGEIVKPTIAVITNAAAAHLEGLKSVEGVAKAKGEIIDSVREDGVVVLNRDDAYFDYWFSLVGQRQCLTFGKHPQADCRLIHSEGDCFTVEFQGVQQRLSCPLLGEHNHLNSAAASLIALQAGLDWSQIAQGLKQVSAVNGRLQTKAAIGSFRLVDDTYNANPGSMEAAICVLKSFPGLKILVLGTMGELGDDAKQRHFAVGELAKQANVDHVYTFCDRQENIDLARQYTKLYDGESGVYKDVDLLVAQVINKATSNATVLVKGSRAAQMERVVAKLEKV